MPITVCYYRGEQSHCKYIAVESIFLLHNEHSLVTRLNVDVCCLEILYVPNINKTRKYL
jgi:hypothetical protein